VDLAEAEVTCFVEECEGSGPGFVTECIQSPGTIFRRSLLNCQIDCASSLTMGQVRNIARWKNGNSTRLLEIKIAGASGFLTICTSINVFTHKGA
jgi:hypothetical protein